MICIMYPALSRKKMKIVLSRLAELRLDLDLFYDFVNQVVGVSSVDMDPGPRFLHLPLKEPGEYVSLCVDPPPPDPTDVLTILKEERVPLRLWMEIGRMYYIRGMYAQFVSIMSDGTLSGIEEFFESAEDSKAYSEMLVSFAWFYVEECGRSQSAVDADVAQTLLNRAENRSPEDPEVCVALGALSVYQGNLEDALQSFAKALEKDPEHVGALTGKARALYAHNRFREALNCYVSIIQNGSRRSFPPDIRCGLGFCYAALNNKCMARKCFLRMLDVDPMCIDAMIALATMDLNETTEKSVDNAVRLLNFVRGRAEASGEPAKYPEALNQLARHAFYCRKYQESIDFALLVYRHCDTLVSSDRIDQLKAEAAIHVARALHVEGKHQEAFQFYTNAVALWPGLVQAQFGLGQSYLLRDDKLRARTCFEKVLELLPEHYETMAVLARINAALNQIDATLTLYSEIPVSMRSAQVWQHMSELYARDATKVDEALSCTRNAIRALEQSSGRIPAELLNNYGVLLHMKGEYSEAVAQFVASVKARENPSPLSLANTTTTYNRLLSLERSGEVGEAEKGHREIIEKHPKYLNSYLRLAAIANNRADVARATDWLKEAIVASPDSLDAWTMLGVVHLQQEQWEEAAKKFEYVRRLRPEDTYARLALASMHLSLTSRTRQREKRDKYLSVAESFFAKVLMQDPSNVYGACGIAAVLAKTGYTAEAQDIFLKAREIMSGPYATVNLAHTYLLQNKAGIAIKTYIKALQLYYDNKDVMLLLYLARAYFSADDFDQCKKTLAIAHDLAPKDPVVQFNKAVVLYEGAKRILNDTRTRTVARLHTVLSDLAEATKLFKTCSETDVANVMQDRNTPSYGQSYDPSVAARSSRLAQAQISVATGVISDVEKEEARRSEQQLQLAAIQKEEYERISTKKVDNESKLRHDREQELALELRAAWEAQSSVGTSSKQRE